MLMLDPTHLRDASRRIFEAAGAPSDVAAQVAEFLVESNHVGHDSHGVIRIPAYLQAISDGLIVPDARPEVIEETATSALVDGKDGFGHIAAAFATDVAARKARESKVAVVSVVRCNHIGRLGEWACRAARQGESLRLSLLEGAAVRASLLRIGVRRGRWTRTRSASACQPAKARTC